MTPRDLLLWHIFALCESVGPRRRLLVQNFSALLGSVTGVKAKAACAPLHNMYKYIFIVQLVVSIRELLIY